MSQSTTSGGGRVTLAVARDGQDLAALAQALADGAAQVGHRAERIGAQPAGAAQVERQHEAADFALRLGDLVGAHRLEVHALQAFLVGHGQHRVHHRRFVLGARPGFARLRHGLGDAAAAGRRAFGLLSFCASSSAMAAACSAAVGIAPEQGERLVEDVLMLVAMDHRGAQRGARLGAAAEIDQRQRLLRGERLRRADRQTGAAQQAREVHDVGGEGGGWRGHRCGGRRTRVWRGRKGRVRARQAAR